MPADDGFLALTPPAGALWGPATARSLHYFAIGAQAMPLALIHAMAEIKRAAAEVNAELGLLPPARAAAIAAAAERVAAGEFDAQFPCSVWQTGSGTQSHMNVNEVLATLAGQADAGGTPVHPNDEVNLGQSSNDVFPSAMHLAALAAVPPLQQALAALRAALAQKAAGWADLIKVGRTHLQDATPLTLGQEFSGYGAQLQMAEAAIAQALPALHGLALGGTAVGTGLNRHPEFAERVVARLAARRAQALHVAANPFAALAGHEALVGLHAALRLLAVALTKIANDLRLMGSGPRAGLGELRLPANEAGSSIMPGKVNPTQIEALLMVCMQVMGHDVAIGIAASQGQFELNACKPLIALNLLDSLRLLTDAMDGLRRHCIEGLQPEPERLAALLGHSLMTVTALVPHLGYERCAQIARHAQQQGLSLRAAALALGALTAEQFDDWADPRRMLGPEAP